MRRILLVLPIIFVAAIAVAVVIAMLTPKSVYREQIKTAAERALGRDVALNGPVGLSFFPRIAASVSDVAVANPEGFDGDNTIEAGELRASVKWLPLMTGRIQIQELALVDATIGLQRLADGRTNWVFANPDAPVETDPDEPTPSGEINAGFDQVRVVNTALTYDDAVSGDRFEFTEFNAEAQARSFSSPLRLKSTGRFDGDLFGVDLRLETPNALLAGERAQADLEFTTDFADIDYNGAVTLGETPSAEGAFDVSVPNLVALAENAGVDISTLPISLAPLGELTARGDVAGPLTALAVSFAELKTDGDAIDTNFTGAVALGDEVSVENGRLTASIQDVARTLADFGVDLAQSAAMQGADLSLSTGLNGPAESLSLSDIDFDLTGPLLTAGYEGDVSLATGGAIDGQLTARSDNLRGLLTSLAVELTAGDTLQTFAFESSMSGSSSEVILKGLDLAVDDTTATGDLNLNLAAARPSLSGALETSALDLTPFMGPAPENQPVGWSKTPLALDSLKAADADITLKSPSIKIDKVTLQDADIKATLVNGRLNADIARVTTFGGRWSGSMGVDAARQVPSLTMALTGDSILIEDLMQTLTASDRIGGTGQFSLNISSAGNSVYDIMNALDGELGANLANGAIKGVNLGQLFRTTGNIRESLASGAFNLGISAEDTTDFASFDTLLTIQDGVASIRAMDLVNSALSAKGNGTIGLGAQTLNMGLQFAADTSGRGQLSDIQLNGLAIPLRITGSWTNPSISPDTTALTRALAGEQIDRLTGSLGGEVGGALSGILGGSRNNADGPQPDESTDEDEPVTAEELVEDVAREALGSLFRRD